VYSKQLTKSSMSCIFRVILLTVVQLIVANSTHVRDEKCIETSMYKLVSQ